MLAQDTLNALLIPTAQEREVNKRKGRNPQSKPRPKSREEANRRDPNKIEKQNDQHGIRDAQPKRSLRQQPQRKSRHDQIRREPHRRDVQQRLETRIGPLVLGHAFDSTLLDSQLAGGTQESCCERGAGGEAGAGDCVAGVDDGGVVVGAAMLRVIRATGGGSLAVGRGLFFKVVVVGGVAHLAYAGSCLDDGGDVFLPRTTVSEMEAKVVVGRGLKERLRVGVQQ